MNFRLIQLSGLLLSFIFFTFIVFPVHADMVVPVKQAFFINQVRGNECCNQGNLGSLEKQMSLFENDQVPAYFALRYDVLTNKDFLSYIKNQATQNPEVIKLGLFLEITPQLAHDAGVAYRGSDSNWFEAQNAYTIGYNTEDRKKIIDYLFQSFYQDFGFYPEVVNAWIIDSRTVDYLYSQYHVKLVEITREQWGTDSYTLYGGPPQYPYPPSTNWALIPDYNQKDNLMMVRQTVSDPLYNYGDTTSGYTSQPNDYSHGNKSFEYFRALADQALNQPGNQPGFILIGLENSMGDYVQDQLSKQIDYVYQMKIRSQISLPTVDELMAYWKNRPVNMYGGKDLVNGSYNLAYWITTPGYRVRIRIDQTKIFIDDLRLYDNRFVDPYNSYIAKKDGYWIVPYLIDGSLQYRGQSYDTKGFLVVKSDINTSTARIILPDTNAQDRSIQFTSKDTMSSFSYKNTQA